MKARGLGTHLMATLVNCDNARLQNYEMIYKLLQHMPYRIDMTLIDVPHNPILHSCFSPKNPMNYGLSGMSLLHESHITIHTWPSENTMDFDIFSCYSFDWIRALRMLSLFFKGEPVNVSVVKRGNNRKFWNITKLS